MTRRGRHEIGAALAAALLAALTTLPARAAEIAIDVTPRPLTVEAGAGEPVRIDQGTPILMPKGSAGARSAATALANLAMRSRRLRLPLRQGGAASGAAIVLKVGRDLGPEAYTLDIGGDRIVITAATAAGFYYGSVTVWQLMTPTPGQGPVAIPPAHIADAPRFSWRGLLIDSARHIQTITELERMIDWMSLHKLNVLQWHLTDDQGWRFAAPGWPRLTSTGAWRTPAFVAGDPRPAPYGGFYTRAKIRALVAYAAARNVVIVPEIEMPGHAASALLAYPELSAGPPPPSRIQSDWGVFPFAFAVEERDFAFLQAALNEIMDLFPSRFVAVGGDEVVKDSWAGSPKVQSRMQALGLVDDKALHAWFFSRISAVLEKRGRRAIGWDEILEGGPLPPQTAVISWRGAVGAAQALAAGHDAVLAPSPTLYLDNRQSELPDEPPGRGAVVSLKDVYAFDPGTYVAGRSAGTLLGLEGALWTEHIRTAPRLEAMAFPRAAALAEVAWSAPERRDWSDFLVRLPTEFARFRDLGLIEDESTVEIEATTEINADGTVTVGLANQAGLGEVRYSLDGHAPDRVYAGPFRAALPSPLRAATFVAGEQVSPVLDEPLDALSVRRRSSQELKSCRGGLTLNLEGDPAASGARPIYLVDIMDPCWIWPAADLDGIVRIEARVGRLPFNFQIGADIRKIVLRPAATPAGELEVRMDGCDRPPLATLPLIPAKGGGPAMLRAEIAPQIGRHDLCFVFTAHDLDPMPVLGAVQLLPIGAAD